MVTKCWCNDIGIQKTGVKQTGVRETRVEQSEDASISSRKEKERSLRKAVSNSFRFLLMYRAFKFIMHLPCDSNTFGFFTKSSPFNAMCTQAKSGDAGI